MKKQLLLLLGLIALVSNQLVAAKQPSVSFTTLVADGLSTVNNALGSAVVSIASFCKTNKTISSCTNHFVNLGNTVRDNPIKSIFLALATYSCYRLYKGYQFVKTAVIFEKQKFYVCPNVTSYRYILSNQNERIEDKETVLAILKKIDPSFDPVNHGYRYDRMYFVPALSSHSLKNLPEVCKGVSRLTDQNEVKSVKDLLKKIS